MAARNPIRTIMLPPLVTPLGQTGQGEAEPSFSSIHSSPATAPTKAGADTLYVLAFIPIAATR